MKWYLLLALLFVAVASAQEEYEPTELPLAEACDLERCQLPDCRCSTTDIPGNLRPRDTPQFVLLTFDDAVNVINIETYRRLLDSRRNSNQCSAAATFFVSHEYTNYQLVNELHNKGHEIALHSISHQTPQSYWQEATPEIMRREFADQRIQLSHFANISPANIHGMRIPFLQMTGNSSFEVMKEMGLTYDSTWPTVNHIDPGLWPYTLAFASTQDCVVPPCPTAAFNDTWVLPMITWRDLNGVACSMVDSCFNVPLLNDENAWFHFILSNFERHYLGNRAPFGFYIHEWYLAVNPAVERALVRFLDMLSNLHDAFMVTGNEVIDWVKRPLPVNEYRTRPCRWFQPSICLPASCGPLHGAHNGRDYWMQICTACPFVYPWVNNPLGLQQTPVVKK